MMELIIDNLTDTLVFVKDKDGHYLFCNRAFCDFFDTSRDEVMSHDPYLREHGDSSEEAMKGHVFRNKKIDLMNGDTLFIKHDITDLVLAREINSHAARTLLSALGFRGEQP
jgi:PAS domain-containing protein